MTLYLYRIGTTAPVLTIENAVAYTADSVTAEDGTVYRPLAEGYELSGKEDCSELLRAQYRQGVYLFPLTAEEARARRDRLLAESDWTQVLDAPIDAETREAYRAYRQALRDVPQQAGFPAVIAWPALPVVGKAEPDAANPLNEYVTWNDMSEAYTQGVNDA